MNITLVRRADVAGVLLVAWTKEKALSGSGPLLRVVDSAD